MSSRSNRPARVLLADDHRLILRGVRNALEVSGQFEIVGEAATGDELMVLVRRTRPDVVLLDLRMPGLAALTCLERIKSRHPEITVVVLSVSSEQKRIQTALELGASAYVVKSVDPVDLPAVVLQAMEETLHSAIGMPGDSSAIAAKSKGLTASELVVLTALVRGTSNAAIAKELQVAPQTVKFHLTSIYRKLRVSNRTEAARYAYQHGLVQSPFSTAEGDASN